MTDVRSPYVWILLVGVALVLVWFMYTHRAGTETPYQVSMSAAHRAFEDRDYLQALNMFATASAARPADSSAYFGQALALMQLDRDHEAMVAFNQALNAVSATREKAFILANRGIQHDRNQRFHEALADYEQALELDKSVADGPGLVSRFVHNQPDAPPTIAARVQYLRGELAKPVGEQLLSEPVQDRKPFPYRQ